MAQERRRLTAARALLDLARSGNSLPENSSLSLPLPSMITRYKFHPDEIYKSMKAFLYEQLKWENRNTYVYFEADVCGSDINNRRCSETGNPINERYHLVYYKDETDDEEPDYVDVDDSGDFGPTQSSQSVEQPQENIPSNGEQVHRGRSEIGNRPSEDKGKELDKRHELLRRYNEAPIVPRNIGVAGPIKFTTGQSSSVQPKKSVRLERGELSAPQGRRVLGKIISRQERHRSVKRANEENATTSERRSSLGRKINTPQRYKISY